MGLIEFLIICIVVGVLCWLAVTFIPMPPQFKTAIPVIAIVVLVLWLLLLIFGGGKDIPIPRVR